MNESAYKKLVRLIIQDVKKTLTPTIRKLIREEVSYAMQLISETKTVSNPKTVEQNNGSTIVNKITTDSYLQALTKNGLEVPEQKPRILRFGGKDISIEPTDPSELLQEQTGITLQGHSNAPLTEEGLKTAIKIQTKDYSSIMKKIL